MKYGDTLRQRSIPQWGPYNVDYDEIKHLIKEHTTPGQGKALSIPGQGEESERHFEDELFVTLADEYRRIDLFVKSKSGEIERRLNHISKQVRQFTLRERASSPSDRAISEKRRQKYARVEADVLKAGEEIKSLARFVGAQRLGFAKLLKKYKKWTGSELLGKRFTQEVLNQPGTFSRTNLSPLLNEWSDVLHAVRAAYQAGENQSVPKIAIGDALSATNASPTVAAPAENLTAIPKQIQSVAESGSELDLDTALANLPLGQLGARAAYWVHADQVVELHVLLLQSLRFFEGRAQTSPQSSPFGSPGGFGTKKRTDSTSDIWRRDEIGMLFMDDVDRYARSRSGSTVVEQEETPGKPAVRAMGSARWTSAGEAAVVAPSANGSNEYSKLVCAKLKRKHLPGLLDIGRPFNARRPSAQSTVEETEAHSDSTELNPVVDLRSWLSSNREIRPIAGISSKRSRFVGLGNDSEHGTWATLDTDIYMDKSLHTHLGETDGLRDTGSEVVAFPHAVLEVRGEGRHSDELIKALDKSHLTERIRGFSLEAHAIWTCCKPASMQPPYWLPMLERDIRKIPSPAPRVRHGAASPSKHLDPLSSRQTSVSNTSVTDGQTSHYSTAARNDSSATSLAEMDGAGVAGQQSSKPSRRHHLRELAALQAAESGGPSASRYWNEYDDPEDGGDDAYVIYVDPYASPKLPGQETLGRFFQSVKDTLRGRRRPSGENASLLSTEGSENDELSGVARDTLGGGYGTLTRSEYEGDEGSENQHARRPRLSLSRRLSSLIDIFRSSDPSDYSRGHGSAPLGADPAALDTLLASLAARQRARAAAKARLAVAALAASAVIAGLTGLLAASSRRKLRSEVAPAVVTGVVADLAFAMVALACWVSSRRDGEAGGLGMGGVGVLAGAVVLLGVCVVDGAVVGGWLV
ncbi:uncharacterized protein K452DRAFT_297901 [Aplosporella prunicola CBS 121167]|uniref:SPX domain-containing protein n=1 Tax=Aplosporella prunicola CBS 121167 TaxID=1176127 RepID=A0A6A6BII5_9PEZI|nr:uncharacterized protein K452DRAFT_297901 [Aplosporella prunicola CBS 121167]KAF2142647.1 hypothetical protein K452DRAFT_297901 [Aplosporella prunicola CBS 121167]